MRFDFKAAVGEYGSVEQRESGSARWATDITFHFATPKAPRTRQVEITIIIMNSAVRRKSPVLLLMVPSSESERESTSSPAARFARIRS